MKVQQQGQRQLSSRTMVNSQLDGRRAAEKFEKMFKNLEY
jgi:hypothetical protein